VNVLNLAKKFTTAKIRHEEPLSGEACKRRAHKVVNTREIRLAALVKSQIETPALYSLTFAYLCVRPEVTLLLAHVSASCLRIPLVQLAGESRPNPTFDGAL
jgi:hypothetical protein